MPVCIIRDMSRKQKVRLGGAIAGCAKTFLVTTSLFISVGSSPVVDRKVTWFWAGDDDAWDVMANHDIPSYNQPIDVSPSAPA